MLQMAYSVNDNTDGDGFTSGAFNMALATLKRINDALIEYKRISTIMGTDGQAQLLKYKMVRQVYLTAVPLMDKETRVEIKKMINGIKMDVAKRDGRAIVIYSAKVDFELDDIVEEMLIKLQEKGNYIMPDADDGDLF